MPAVSQARSIVGTIASRWARLATSGTTPPNRACSSTLLATASASRVSPRTMPTPVSSHEVSIPSTSGPSLIRGPRRIGSAASHLPGWAWPHHAEGWVGQQNGPVREVTGSELVATYDDPFVRHQTDPAAVVRAFVLGPAAIIESRSHMPGATGTLLMALGPMPALGELTNAVVDVIDAPGRISVGVDSIGALPEKWRPARVKQWHWMATREAPPPPTLPVEEVPDADEVNGLLDAFAPDAHARPGSPRVECWLGFREQGVLLAVGALARQHDRTGHLRAVTVAPEIRGRGVGREVSAALTRRALDGLGRRHARRVRRQPARRRDLPASRVLRRAHLRVGAGQGLTLSSSRVSRITTAVAPSR